MFCFKSLLIQLSTYLGLYIYILFKYNFYSYPIFLHVFTAVALEISLCGTN